MYKVEYKDKFWGLTMRRVVFLLLIFASTAILRADERVIIPELKGIVLMGDEEEFSPWEAPSYRGVHVRGVCVPGGIERFEREVGAQFIGKPLTQKGLSEIKQEVILYWRRCEHPLVVVEVPEQDISGAVLRLVVVEGCLGKVICRGNRWFSDSALLGYVQLKPGQAITADTLLTDVAWMNHNPFRHTDLIFTPGDEEGQTDVELVTKDRFPFRPYLGGDNTGNGTTGQARWFGGFNWGNAFGCAHILSYQATVATEVKRFQAHSLHYTAPLPWRHVLIFFGGYARIEPDLTDFHSTGRSWQASGRYTIPLNPLYRSFLREFSFGVDFKHTNNNFEWVEERALMAFGNNINISQLYGSYSMGKELKKHKFTLNLELYYSPGQIFPHQSDADYDELRHRATARYIYGRFTIGDIYTLPKDFSASLLARVQLADGNLLPSEQFGLGGYDTVRGYDEREINADNALCLNGELRLPPLCPLKWFGLCRAEDELLFMVFLDYGLGWNVHRLPAEKHYHYLIGAGPGLRYNIGKNVSIRADLGFKLHKTQFSTDKRYRWHVGGMISF